ncbi:hypothetical protein ACFX2C_036020 [Malus domestica]
MGENLTLANSFALAERHALWDRPNSLAGMRKKMSVETVPQTKMTQYLRRSPSSQFQLARFSINSRMNHGSNCHHPWLPDKVLRIPPRAASHYQWLPEMKAVPREVVE